MPLKTSSRGDLLSRKKQTHPAKLDVNCSGLQQLSSIVNVLQKHKIDYWLDSGTLLGVVREGRLLSSDHDIDISMFWTDDFDLRALCADLEVLGYRVQTPNYKGEVFKIWLEPHNKRKTKKRPADIRFFRTEGDYAYSAQFNTALRSKPSTVPELTNIPRLCDRIGLFAASRLILFLNLSVTSKILKPWQIFLGCWWVPLTFFKARILFDNKFYIPESFEDYLEFRYGDWRVPNPDWDFHRDDPALIRELPETLKKMYNT